MVRNPGTKPGVAAVMQSGQGNGKGFLGSAIGCLFESPILVLPKQKLK